MISVWQGFENRQNNRLSVRPLLVVKIHQAAPKVGLWLENNGLGPAELRELSVYKKGRLIAAGPEAFAHLRELLDLGDLTVAYISRLDPGIWLTPGETLALFRFPEVHHTPERIERFKVAFDGLMVGVGYRSIYGEEFSSQ